MDEGNIGEGARVRVTSLGGLKGTVIAPLWRGKAGLWAWVELDDNARPIPLTVLVSNLLRVPA